ncbi:hypothetical protein NUU61_000433 [Penicillium alfredii]|uniref:SUI1 domain-containing protein n=1 Tax=Penicillium alfredii TaxID=1506179 RepID=A0A9W9KPQ7_9EURO|nr:uncharacterized protein NUU61_000433 [Penicillium alfredii]KAJ5114674.1 hypothetical protein NUU61_000433 [Penicillium alfredii]
MSIENLKTFDPFAEADEDTGETKQSQNYIHIRIQQRNGRKTLTTVQGLPKKFDQKKILKVIKKKFACNGTIVADTEMGEVIQLQGDQRKDVQEFLTDKKEGLELDAKTIKSMLPCERWGEKHAVLSLIRRPCALPALATVKCLAFFLHLSCAWRVRPGPLSTWPAAFVCTSGRPCPLGRPGERSALSTRLLFLGRDYDGTRRW